MIPTRGADLRDAVFKRITLRGFIVSDFYPERLLPIREQIGELLRAKRLRVVVSEFEGLDARPRRWRRSSTAGRRTSAAGSSGSRNG